MPTPLMRSKLFVPGTRPELFDKAVASGADAVSFDLEDAVAASAKAQARAHVAAALQRWCAAPPAALLIVRVNALGSPWFDDDLRAAAQPGVALINLPKAGCAADVQQAAAALARAEVANGVAQPIGLLVNIETPAALLRAGEIAAAHPRVAGLQLGLADLFEPLGIARASAANVHAALFALRLAAAAAGVWACDAAFADLHDTDGFRAEALVAQQLGFIGKSCIHPRQVAIANGVFQASADALAAAQRVVDAARAAGGGGNGTVIGSASERADSDLGVFVVDGQMVDAPYLQRARALLAAAAGRGGLAR